MSKSDVINEMAQDVRAYLNALERASVSEEKRAELGLIFKDFLGAVNDSSLLDESLTRRISDVVFDELNKIQPSSLNLDFEVEELLRDILTSAITQAKATTPPPPPGRRVSPVGVTAVVDLTELKDDIAPKANQGSFDADYNKYKKHFDDFLAYFKKQSKTDFYSSRPREDLKFYTIDDSGYKQDLAAKIFAQQIDEVNLNREDSIDFIKKHFMSTIIGSVNDVDDFSHIYNTYEKILQETELGYTPVQMLLDLSDNFISKYKEQYLKVLDKAIEDNTFSVNGPSEPYITVENLPDILDKMIAYKHNRGIELLFKSENFARLLFDQDSQAEVKTVLKTRISNGTLRKALGDSFEQTIIDVAEEFNDKNKETILKALSNKKDINNDRDDDRSSNRRRDESKEEVVEVNDIHEKLSDIPQPSKGSQSYDLVSKLFAGVAAILVVTGIVIAAISGVGAAGVAGCLFAGVAFGGASYGVSAFGNYMNNSQNKVAENHAGKSASQYQEKTREVQPDRSQERTSRGYANEVIESRNKSSSNGYTR